MKNMQSYLNKIYKDVNIINKNSFIIEPEINGCNYYFYDGNTQYKRYI